jgi:hypothetical protein
MAISSSDFSPDLARLHRQDEASGATIAFFCGNQMTSVWSRRRRVGDHRAARWADIGARRHYKRPLGEASCLTHPS